MCEKYYSMPLATCHLPVRHLPLALTFQPKYTKNSNANENETNDGVKMKTFVEKRENRLCACFLFCVCACVGSGQSWATFRVRVRWLSDVTRATSMRGLLMAFWANATAAATSRSGSTVVCSRAHRSSYSLQMPIVAKNKNENASNKTKDLRHERTCSQLLNCCLATSNAAAIRTS